MERRKAKEPAGDVIYDTLTVDGKTVRCGVVSVDELIEGEPAPATTEKTNGGPLRRIFNFGLRFSCLLMRIASIYLELISCIAEFVKRGNPIAVGLFRLAWALRRYAEATYPLNPS